MIPGESIVHVKSLMEVLDAAYLSKFVQTPFQTRGGVILIGPPETLRTTITENVFSDYPDSLVLSDINVKQLMEMREDMAAGKLTVLVFSELAKLYARNPAVAKNIEAHIMMLIEEGMSLASFTDKRISSSKARVMVIACCTEKFYSQNFTRWMDSGFARRFLHCMYRLDNPWALADAQETRTLIDFGDIRRKLPGNRSIRWNVSPEEMKALRKTLKFQFRKGVATPFHLSANIYCVLKWKYDEKEARRIWFDFAESLQGEGAVMTL